MAAPERHQERWSDAAAGCCPCREEAEKFNVWLAYLNLENQYGEEPEEAALKLFQRALQYTEPKKLHLAALAMFERSSRTVAAEQLVKAMVRKFGGSAKVRSSAMRRVTMCREQHSSLCDLPASMYARLPGDQVVTCMPMIWGLLSNVPMSRDREKRRCRRRRVAMDMWGGVRHWQTQKALLHPFGEASSQFRPCSFAAQVWLRAIGWELRKGEGEGARKMLERGLQSLPRRKHIKVHLTSLRLWVWTACHRAASW